MPRPGAGTQATPVEATGVAFEHLLGADPVLAALVKAHGPLDSEHRRRGRPTEAYGALLRSIVGQQLSTKAARTIYGRLIDLYGGHDPAPEQILATEAEVLRGVGLSRAKAAYLRSLAEHVIYGELELDRLPELDDDEVIAQLTAVKGLGPWTAHMFLIFHLGRPDVLPVGDLGVRRAVELAYGLEGLPSGAELEQIAEPWRPYRSLASLYLWRSLDNEPG
ncbi:MAG: DNA-3-methyladenine glycosylase [Actinomycetota bacterium]|nr:DNA-3-methyladenine glycosylase [Actinomycetota bacterium]